MNGPIDTVNQLFEAINRANLGRATALMNRTPCSSCKTARSLAAPPVCVPR